MDKLKESINNLKDRIELDIRQIGLYSDSNNIKDALLKEYNSCQYNENDELSLKTYYAWLQVFYTNRVEVINKSIVNNMNNNIYDNSTSEQLEKIKKLETNIEEALNYVKDNYHEIKGITDEYYKLKDYYENEYNSIIEISKRRFNNMVGLLEEPVVSTIFEKDHIRSSIPTLSLYQDAYTIRNIYIHKLEAFNIDSIKLFVENDLRIRKIFTDAYKEITDNDIIEIIKEMENNYYTGINQSIENGFMFLGLDQIQEIMTESCNKVKEMTESAINSKYYYNKIIGMTLNIDIDTVLDIYKFTEASGLYKEEFYYNLYILIENEKHMIKRFNIKPVIYPNLPDKLKNIIEKEFTDYLDSCKSEDQQEIVERLKKYGYLGVYDDRYSNFFDNLVCSIDIDCDIEEKKYNIYNFGKYKSLVFFKNKGREYYYDNGYTKIDDEVNVIPLKLKDVNELFSSKYLYTKCQRKNYFIDRESGELTVIPIDFSKVSVRHLLDLYVIVVSETLNRFNYTIYNSNFEFVEKVEDIYMHYIDYNKNKLVLKFWLSSVVKIYDNNFKYIIEFDLNDILENAKLAMVKDGVFTLYNDEKIIYYDYINDKVIAELPYNDCLGYNEGLYIYCDKGLYGYKNNNGEVVIQPRFTTAKIFMNGIAKVSIEKSEGIIGRSGFFISDAEVLSKIYNNRKKYYEGIVSENKIDDVDFKRIYMSLLRYDNRNSPIHMDHNQYDVYAMIDDRNYCNYNCYTYSGKLINKLCSGKLIITEKYKVDIDTPIMNIDFYSNNKVKKII